MKCRRTLRNHFFYSLFIDFSYNTSMHISLRALRYIVATADYGSISAAARRLNLSQPSISSAIAEFEQAVGATLFMRHHAKGVTLTPAGRRLINEARALIKHAEDFSRTAQAIGGSLQGEIHIGCFVSLAPCYMPPILAAFGTAYPGISVHIDEGDQEHVLGALAAGRTELAVTYDLGIPGEMTAHSLVELPPLAVMPAAHPLTAQEAVALADFVKEPLIFLDLPLSRVYFMSLFHAHGVEPRIAWRTRSYEFVRSMVASGHGLAIHNVVPRTNTTYAGGELAIRPFREPMPALKVVCLSMPSLSLRPAVKAFAEYLGDAFAAGTV
jgi:DNA-binding transcriptional LysR family regulator